jgi:uncharacterized protein (TIGR01244 family)
MTKRLVLFLVFVLSAVCAIADEGDLSAVSSLKVDLDAVVELGEVYPVDGITASGQPSEASFQVFAEEGYAAVIDLRTAGEDRGLDEPAVVEALGMDYISLPIGRDGITTDNAIVLGRLIQGYDEPVLVHCGSSNRVGALLALKAFSDSGDAELALEVGRAGGLTRLEGTVKEVMGVD